MSTSGEAWIKAHAKELCDAGINPLELSSELQELKPALVSKRALEFEKIMAVFEAPAYQRAEIGRERAQLKLSMEHLALLSDAERTIFHGYAHRKLQKDIALEVGLTQGGVSAKLRHLSSKLSRLNIVRKHDWEPALAGISEPLRREACKLYLASFHTQTIQKKLQRCQGWVSTSIQLLKVRVPEKVWEALNPKRPLIPFDVSNRQARKKGAQYYPPKHPSTKKVYTPEILKRNGKSSEEKAKRTATALKRKYEKKSGHKL